MRRLGGAFFPSALMILGGLSVIFPQTARAQDPPPVTVVQPGTLPCIGMPPLALLTEDPALAIENFRATVRTVTNDRGEPVDEVVLRWDAPATTTGLRCLALYRRYELPDTYYAFTELYPFLGSGILLRPAFLNSSETDACWRLVALADGRKGSLASVCATITNWMKPNPPDDGGAPPSPSGAGVVMDLRVVVTVEIVNPDGTFIPHADRKASAHVTWKTKAGSAGAFLVEKAAVRSAGDQPVYETLTTVSGASVALDGTYTLKDPIPFLQLQTCYRVTPIANGVAGLSSEVCTIRPPTTGPGVDSGAPVPPDAGGGIRMPRASRSGETTLRESALPAGAILAVIGAIVALTAAGWRRLTGGRVQSPEF